VVAITALCVVFLVAAVVAIVSAPLRARSEGEHGRAGAALEAAREAKYRELRDAELDYRTGKLARADYESVSATLRREALAILNRIEALEAGSDLQEQDRVAEQQQGEHDGPAVEVSLDHGAAAEGPGAAAHAEGAREPRVLAGVHEHEQDEHNGDNDLK
jgi:hypothetical protein